MLIDGVQFEAFIAKTEDKFYRTGKGKNRRPTKKKKESCVIRGCLVVVTNQHIPVTNRHVRDN